MLRAIVSLAFLTVIIRVLHVRNLFITGFCLVYSLSSFLTIWYEISVFTEISLLIDALSLWFLVKLTYRKIKYQHLSKLFITGLIVVVLVNVWLIYSFLEILYGILDSLSVILSISTISFSFFVVTILAFVRTNESSSSASIVFVFFLIFLMFADMFRGMGYYGFVDSVYGQYIARVLLVIAFSVLSYFSLLQKKKVLL